jgi:hypothetical protein
MWNPLRKKDTPVDPLVYALYNQHACPDCNGDKFTMGPQGGGCQNIKCSNLDCGSEFNVSPFDDGQWLDTPFIVERIDRSESDSKAIYGRGYGKLHPTTVTAELAEHSDAKKAIAGINKLWEEKNAGSD